MSNLALYWDRVRYTYLGHARSHVAYGLLQRISLHLLRDFLEAILPLGLHQHAGTRRHPQRPCGTAHRVPAAFYPSGDNSC